MRQGTLFLWQITSHFATVEPGVYREYLIYAAAFPIRTRLLHPVTAPASHFGDIRNLVRFQWEGGNGPK